MKYSEIVGVEEHFKSAFDITSDFGDSWKTFISNDKFENNMGQIIKSFTSPVFNNRKSIWVQGTYGTGKSHSLAVIEHLLCDEYENIEDYLPRINKAQIRNEIANFRKEKKVFPVVLKGIYAITDVADLTYIIQQQVAAALRDKNIDIATKTDFQSVIQILKRGDLDSFFENLINKNIELQGYAANKEQLILALENNETKVLRIIADELKDAGLGGFRTHNIIEWLTEVKKELENRKIADYLMLFWDEFTSLLDIPARRSILNVIQDIAEMSYSEISDGKDTLGVYIMLVTHKRLEQTESYKDLKEDERNMAKARFVELDYGMQPTTTYHILSGALEKRQPDILDDLRQKNFLDVASVMGIVDKVIDSDAPNAKEVKDKIISLYPFHPYTSYLATFVSRVVGEAERSIFGFLNDEDNGFKKYIEHDVEESKFLTADYMVYEAQRNVILKIAEKESCVIIGRNADFILKDREDVLNVFIHGDMPEKVQRICKLYNVAEADAAKMITETDKRRRTNYNFYTDQKWGMAGNYSLSLNSSQLGYDRCEKIILECVK